MCCLSCEVLFIMCLKKLFIKKIDHKKKNETDKGGNNLAKDSEQSYYEKLVRSILNKGLKSEQSKTNPKTTFEKVKTQY